MPSFLMDSLYIQSALDRPHTDEEIVQVQEAATEPHGSVRESRSLHYLRRPVLADMAFCTANVCL